MKKRNIVLCMILIMVLCFTMGTGSAFAVTYTTDNAPEVKLDETFTVEIQKTQESQAETKDMFAAKFTPEETGSYMVNFDTTFDAESKSEDDPAMLMFLLTSDPDSEEADEDGGFVTCMSTKGLTEEELEEAKESIDLMRFMGISFDDPTFTAELKKGKTYYLMTVLSGSDSYTSNVKITAHTHDIEEVKEPATYKKEDDFDLFTSGGWYETCKVEHCNYYKEKASYPAVNTVELSKKAYAYNGKAKTPAVTIEDTEGNLLKQGTDYKVEYKNNVKAGKAKVVIRFQGNYKGKYTKFFRINPPKTTLKKVKALSCTTAKVTWKKAAYPAQVDGYQIAYSTKKSFKNAKHVIVKGPANTCKIIKSLKCGKRYYFKVRAYKLVGSTVKYKSAWSGWKSVVVGK